MFISYYVHTLYEISSFNQLNVLYGSNLLVSAFIFSLNYHFGSSAGVFLSLTQSGHWKKLGVIMPNVLSASVLIMILRPSVLKWTAV